MAAEVGQVAAELGLNPGLITEVAVLSTRHGHRIWRVHIHTGRSTGKSSFVIKWFPEISGAAVEIGAYRLLQELDVPTLAVYGTSDHALLLEDLAASERWRAAEAADAEEAVVGEAIGRWYKLLHQRGSAFLEQGLLRPSFLRRESDALDERSLAETAFILGLSDHPHWQAFMEALPLLKQAEAALRTTLCYNDFHWTNLALSRKAADGRLEALVYDYHLIGIGLPYSDCRNVTGSLGPRAAAAFMAAYGTADLDPREEVIDRPLSTVYSLVVAARLPRFPAWAQESLEAVTSGRLGQALEEAVLLAEEIIKGRSELVAGN
ncbi:MAG TPA: hypothetical protein GXX29_00775 [Firmicutes bacterium]|nr:hypothetical protein [Bacillota bacterium]